MAVLSAASSRRRSSFDEGAIDLAHLARMTLGERSLEREVLTLFDRQAAILLARMNDAPAAAVASFAHTLKGSARSIGAWEVAAAAEAVESAATGADRSALARTLAELGPAIGDARMAIEALLGR
jgi:HPt (histidine-containing phosphotransfer) domain-containing protein